jgi:hypothetical protein
MKFFAGFHFTLLQFWINKLIKHTNDMLTLIVTTHQPVRPAELYPDVYRDSKIHNENANISMFALSVNISNVIVATCPPIFLYLKIQGFAKKTCFLWQKNVILLT